MSFAEATTLTHMQAQRHLVWGNPEAYLVKDIQERQQQHDANIGECNAHKDLLPKCVNLQR